MKKWAFYNLIGVAFLLAPSIVFSMNNGFAGHGFTPVQLSEVATFSAVFGQLKLSIESDKDAHTAYADFMASLGNPSYVIDQRSKNKLQTFGIDPDQMNNLKMACVFALNEEA